jgi:formylglycine-generating enzyme required for sulfatase activity
MVVIPAGTFRMGDIYGDGTKFEQPVHTVKIPKPFAIGRYEVTFEEYDRFAAGYGSAIARRSRLGPRPLTCGQRFLE